MNKYKIIEHEYDVVVLGAGGAGLRAAVGLSEAGLKTACISKVFPTRSHTSAAQGGISAALGNMGEDDWRWHMYDTVKGSDWLGDQDCIEYLCKEAPRAVLELEKYGVPFSRTEDGKIYQRPFGGMTKNYGNETVQRTCAAADRTGHAILHTMYGQALKHNTEFFIEYFALDLLMKNGECKGVLAWNLNDGTIHRFRSHITILATGGCGQVFQRTTNPTVATGDGLALAIRSGAAVRDLEFYQFHPTCLALDTAPRFLVSEALRGEGGRLLDHCGDAFMSRYDKRADLAPRDIVARAIHQEMTSAGGRPVFLDMTHLSRDVLSSRFPSIFGVCMNAGLDISTSPIPVSPAAHYACGGIRVDTHGNTTIEGLSAVGEVACTGLHGANRLASNSLLEAVVYAERIVAHLKADRLTPVHSSMVRVGAGQSVHRPIDQTVRDELLAASAQLKTLMWTHASILRSGAGLALTFNAASALSSRLDTILESYYLTRELAEIRHMSVVSMQMVRAAQRRKKSVGLHYRTDV